MRASMKHGVVTILAVDGGGVRGILPALIVRDLMRRINFLELWRWRRMPVRLGMRAGPRAAAEVFDLFAGTSTGALVTLGLARADAYSPERILRLYHERAREIFPPARFSTTAAVRQAFTVKYDREPLEDLFLQIFGGERLGECRSNVLIAAYDTDHRSPFFFKHYSQRTCRKNPRVCRDAEDYRDFYLRDVARATTAAPTFFEPSRITATDGKVYTLVDGALAANNPALSAYVEARKLYRDARRYIIVSLGTGRSTRRYPWETIHRWGYLDWVSPLHGVPLNAMFSDGQSEVVAHALKQLPRVTYFRFNADLAGDVNEDMDDAGPENMAALERMGRDMIRRFSPELHRLAKLLQRHRLY
ncbi:MAG: hypothetical protein EA427_17250 [Spirochaetaceae bacterium]|nr:MAG: hypothetical protein EA427_17250 [Spirochaetaceae bacterium]